MGDLNAVELRLTGERVSLPIPVASPVNRGSLDVCVSTARGGPPVHSTLSRSLVVRDGMIPPLELFTRDVRAIFPRGARVWLVVRYGSNLIATGPLVLTL